MNKKIIIIAAGVLAAVLAAVIIFSAGNKESVTPDAEHSAAVTWAPQAQAQEPSAAPESTEVPEEIEAEEAEESVTSTANSSSQSSSAAAAAYTLAPTKKPVIIEVPEESSTPAPAASATPGPAPEEHSATVDETGDVIGRITF